MNTSFEDLAAAIRDRRAMLFAGAGVSMSVGLPSWDELIGHLQNQLSLETVDKRISYHTLAEYYRLRQGSIGPLRSWMDRTWNVSRDKVASSEIHRCIVDLDFPIVYTTNYDNNLEIAYDIYQKPYLKITNTHDLVGIDGLRTQIVKFHGDFADDTTLVIAETDYLKRLAFETPIDTKFKADSLGRTLLFIGYSVSDLNIRLLLYRLWQTWRDTGRERERPGVYVFTPNPDPIQTAVLQQWGITVISRAGTPQEALIAFLGELRDAVLEGAPRA
ncbi:Sir2 family NAD-dependent protein deacetylase [Sphingomonas sp. AP4-R1]|uniref:SIR2 family protein n=1 Tax=Sphingomonas sp. AP4-R1 TaxID=2735134 RepID=UPI001493B1BB|nr:SIR2 family protein [Sphingomonas sp. AP4-R1]QJU58334.1 Sir2 family NAD-dependent protein deacetylase [Sphingomonas sp. AP4-R1]